MPGQASEDDVDQAYVAKVHQAAKGTHSQIVWINAPKKRQTTD